MPTTPAPVRVHSPTGRPAPAALTTALVLLGALVAAVLPSLVLAPAASAAPASRTPSRTIEVYSRYQPQTTCSPQAKPGVVLFMKMTLKSYPGTGSSGIVRACAQGGRSEHKEGRAWDWRLDHSNPRQRQQASDMVRWLLATDAYGNQRAQARRLGLMYVIWNRKIWSASSPDAGWRTYTGADSHTTHMHFSFSVLGAQGATSFWTGKVPPPLVPARPAPVATLAPYQPLPPVESPQPAPSADVPTGTPTEVPAGSPTDPATGALQPAGPAPTVPPATAPPQPVLDQGEAALTVPASGERITTAFALRAGRRYLLTVRGTYRYGDGRMTADAECARRPGDGRWRPLGTWEGTPGHGHLDLEVAGETGDWTPRTSTGRGCDTRDHVYTRTVLATKDAPLVVRLVDDVVTDNTGSLSLRVSVLDSSTTSD